MFDRYSPVAATNRVAVLAGAKIILMKRTNVTSEDVRRRIIQDDRIIELGCPGPVREITALTNSGSARDEITTPVSRLRRVLARQAPAAVEDEDCLETVRRLRERFASPGEGEPEAGMAEIVESVPPAGRRDGKRRRNRDEGENHLLMGAGACLKKSNRSTGSPTPHEIGDPERAAPARRRLLRSRFDPVWLRRQLTAVAEWRRAPWLSAAGRRCRPGSPRWTRAARPTRATPGVAAGLEELLGRALGPASVVVISVQKRRHPVVDGRHQRVGCAGDYRRGCAQIDVVNATQGKGPPIRAVYPHGSFTAAGLPFEKAARRYQATPSSVGCAEGRPLRHRLGADVEQRPR